MHSLYGFCNGNVTIATKEHWQRITDQPVFSNIHWQLQESGLFLSISVTAEWPVQQKVDKEENIIEVGGRAQSTC